MLAWLSVRRVLQYTVSHVADGDRHGSPHAQLYFHRERGAQRPRHQARDRSARDRRGDESVDRVFVTRDLFLYFGVESHQADPAFRRREWPGGPDSNSGKLGHDLMDHHVRLGAAGTIPELEDLNQFGPRFNPSLISRYRNLMGATRNYLRCFGCKDVASRANWARAFATMNRRELSRLRIGRALPIRRISKQRASDSCRRRRVAVVQS